MRHALAAQPFPHRFEETEKFSLLVEIDTEFEAYDRELASDQYSNMISDLQDEINKVLKNYFQDNKDIKKINVEYEG